MTRCLLLHRFPMRHHRRQHLRRGNASFVVGTTPEAVLLIAAHDQSSSAMDQPAWAYALAPSTGNAITAPHNGVEVWGVEDWSAEPDASNDLEAGPERR